MDIDKGCMMYCSVAYACDAMGMTIRKQTGEYRVAFKIVTLIRADNHQSPEDSAYYTYDLRDALATAIAMHSQFLNCVAL